MSQKVVVESLSVLSPVITESIEAGSEVILTVTGNSMRPYLRHLRDQVVLKKCDPRALKVGDVPLYQRADGSFVLHRVVALGASTYTMCGDAQTQKEYGVPNSRILAVATGFYRRGKYVSCDAFSYRLYMRLWLAVLPCRGVLLKCGSVCKRIGRVFTGGKRGGSH